MNAQKCHRWSSMSQSVVSELASRRRSNAAGELCTSEDLNKDFTEQKLVTSADVTGSLLLLLLLLHSDHDAMRCLVFLLKQRIKNEIFTITHFDGFGATACQCPVFKNEPSPHCQLTHSQRDRVFGF